MLKVVGASWNQTKIITTILGAMLALGVVVYIFGETEELLENGIYSATVFYSEDSGFHINYWGQGQNLAEIPKGVARAHYKTEIAENGWAFLDIESNQDSPDWHQAFAAGALEGGLSWQLIYWHWYNTVRFSCDGRENFCSNVRSFLQENWEWMSHTAKEQESIDPFWHQVHLYSMQLKGLEHGFKLGVERSRGEYEIPSEDFIWMNAFPDLAELEQKFNGTMTNGFGYSKINSFSSAFVKILPDSKKLILAHNTGRMFQSMQRILKKYQFHYHKTSAQNSPEVPGQIISFSSYPGVLFSQDDFYSVSNSRDKVGKNQLVIAGCAINNNNFELWNYINSTGKVLLGPRVMSANRLATSGHSWGITLVRYNSGTGNKQWIVVDYTHPFFYKSRRHHLRHSQRKPKGLLWIWEQYPGNFEFSDQTHLLYKKTYWAAFDGLPFHEALITLGNLKTKDKDHTSLISDLFEQKHTTATDVLSTLALMRSNWFSENGVDETQKSISVATRADLSESDPYPAGAIDTKVICGNFTELEFRAVSGPSLGYTLHDYSDDDIENDVVNYRKKFQPFQWSLSKFSGVFHVGQPDAWHFNEVTVKWFSDNHDKN